MASNSTYARAKAKRDDECYTRREDIEAELGHYADQFEGKRVYCNCDDPEWSEFWQFFKRQFKPWGLKSLTATHFEPDAANFAYRLDMSVDTNGDGVIDVHDEPVVTQIECNGDFRNQICIDMLDEADIVCTNPPFSLFREYITQLIEHDKRFLIIGPNNGVKYRETFPFFKDEKVWLGYTRPKKFRVPDGTTGGNVVVEDGVTYKKFGNVYWFTNLDVPERHVPLDLRGVYYDEDKYPHYNNFDGIDVAHVGDIPCDYFGNIGVPISYMEHHCPSQFEIVGLGEGNLAKEMGTTKCIDRRAGSKLEVLRPDGTPKYPAARIVIRRKDQPS